MKPITNYAELVKNDAAYTGIDFDTRMRRVMQYNIQYWEHGEVRLCNRGSRNPDFRKSTSHMLGVDMSMLSEIRYKLFTPDGELLRKVQFRDNVVLLRDLEHNIAVDATWGGSVVYKSVDVVPVSTRNFVVYKPNLLAEKELWPEVLNWWTNVQVQKRMGVGAEERNYVRTYLDQQEACKWMQNPAQPEGDVRRYLWLASQNDLRTLFRSVTDVATKYPYLLTKEVTK